MHQIQQFGETVQGEDLPAVPVRKRSCERWVTALNSLHPRANESRPSLAVKTTQNGHDVVGDYEVKQVGESPNDGTPDLVIDFREEAGSFGYALEQLVNGAPEFIA